MVRKPGFQPGNGGSIPPRAIYKGDKMYGDKVSDWIYNHKWWIIGGIVLIILLSGTTCHIRIEGNI